jgi:excisionase family DNA binding protein
MERLMTTEEVAEILRIDAVTVRRLVARGELTAYRIAGEYRFTEAEVEHFIQSQRVVLTPATTVQAGKFNEHALKVLSLASEEAGRYRHREVGPEHLLLAVLRVEGSVGARTLMGLQVQPAELRKLVETAHPAADEQAQTSTQPGMTSQGKDTMELAVQEARGFSHHYIGTEHIVLALLRQEDSVAGLVLRKMGATYDAARGLVVQLLADQAPNAPEPGKQGE